MPEPKIEADNRAARRRDALEDAKCQTPRHEGMESRQQYRKAVRARAKEIFHAE